MSFRNTVLAFFVILCALGTNAQYISTAPTAVKADVHPQLVQLVNQMNAAPTYGGTFQRVAVNGKKRRVASSTDVNSNAAFDPTARFDFRPSEIELNPRNLDQYVIPASVSFNNAMPANLVRRVDVEVNGVPRGHLGFEVDGVMIDNVVKFDIPLLATDIGTVRLSVKITPTDGSSKETAEWDYTIPSCRVPKIILTPNPVHGIDFAKFRGQVHGLQRNLMPSFALLLWVLERWEESLRNLDVSKPRSEWPGVIRVSSTPVEIDSNGNIRVTVHGLPEGVRAFYTIVIPSTCGVCAKGDGASFYTDEAPERSALGMSIEMIKMDFGQLAQSRITLEDVPAGGWLVSWAQGRGYGNWWSYSPASYPALVEAKEGSQARIFEYALLAGFTHTVYGDYYGVTPWGDVELLLEGSIDGVGGTIPFYLP